MRILATNPDTIGDVILRQPLYRGLQEAGHELMLAVRPLLEPVLGSIAPGAHVLSVRAPIYDPRITPEDASFDEAAERAKAFDPDILLVAPYQWTALSERLARELPRARVVAMSGRAFVDVHHGPAYTSALRISDRVEVAEDAPEPRKNELLAGAVLGRAIQLPQPRIQPAPEHLTAAGAVLSRIGFEPGGYIVACIGENKWTSIRNWSLARWGEALRHYAQQHRRRILLIGTQEEAASAMSVREAMGDASSACAEWFGATDGDLDILLGLIAGASAYIGRDTGPMHIAAALGKPVIAVFGGGTWPRFLPNVDPSISITLGVPCAGCNWVCHLPTSYCIKEVPIAEVIKAIDDIESGAVKQRETRVLAPDATLLARIGREGAICGRANLTQLSKTRRQLMEQTQSLTERIEVTARQAGRADELARELEATRNEMARRESLLRQRLAAAEAMFAARERELLAKVDETRESLKQAQEQARAQIEAEVRHKVASEAAVQTARETDLRTRHSRTLAELTEAQAQVVDFQLKFQKLQQEHAALSKWTRQIEQELEMVRPRLHELMSSRWRKYGQRLHLCMTLPWEREHTNGNGKH